MAFNNIINANQQGTQYLSSAGVWTGVDASTATYVLTSNGTGVAPSFQAGSGGGGKMKIGLNPGSAEITGTSDDCTIVGTAGATNTTTKFTYAEFAQSVIQNARFVISGVLTKDYGGGAITIIIKWNSVPIVGNVVWAVSLVSIADGTAIDVAYNGAHSTTTTVAGTTLTQTSSSWSFTPSGTELVAGETLLVEFQRTGTSGSDTMAGIANVYSFGIYEN